MSSNGRVHRRRHRFFLRDAAGAVVLAGVLLGPLLALLWATGVALVQGHGDWLLLALPLGRRAMLLLRSLALAAGVSVVDMALGVLIVSASWRWRRPWLRWLALMLLALPPTIHALAWNAVFDRAGVRLAGPWVSLWVAAMALLPVGVGLALVSLETVSRPLVEAARVHAARLRAAYPPGAPGSPPDLRVLWRVVLPLAGPLLAAGSGIIFLLQLMDYSIPSLYGVNVYTLEIFAEFSASYAPARALLLAAPLLALAVLLLHGGQAWLRGAAQEPSWRLAPWSTPPEFSGNGLGRAFVLAQQAAVAMGVLQVAAPPLVLLGLWVSGAGAWALEGPAAREFGTSLGVAGAAALLSAPVSALVVWAIRRRPRWGWLFFLPAALPAPLVGTGLIALWNQPWLGAVYPSLALPVLAALARFTPFAALALLAQMRRVDPLLLEAARIYAARIYAARTNGVRAPHSGPAPAAVARLATRVFPPHWWRALLRVQLPLVWPGLGAGMCLVFALTLGELGATLLVAPPGQSTLVLRIYNYLHYGASEGVAGLSLALLLATLAAAGLGLLIIRLGARVGAAAREATEETE